MLYHLQPFVTMFSLQCEQCLWNMNGFWMNESFPCDDNDCCVECCLYLTPLPFSSHYGMGDLLWTNKSFYFMAPLRTSSSSPPFSSLLQHNYSHILEKRDCGTVHVQLAIMRVIPIDKYPPQKRKPHEQHHSQDHADDVDHRWMQYWRAWNKQVNSHVASCETCLFSWFRTAKLYFITLTVCIPPHNDHCVDRFVTELLRSNYYCVNQDTVACEYFSKD